MADAYFTMCVFFLEGSPMCQHVVAGMCHVSIPKSLIANPCDPCAYMVNTCETFHSIYEETECLLLDFQ